MTVNITFYTIAEKKPKHKEDIIYLKLGRSFDSEYYEPMRIKTEYCWFEVDENDEHTGNQICYSSRSKILPDNCKLEIMFDCYCVNDEMLWVPIKEYWASFKEHRKLLRKKEEQQEREHKLKVLSRKGSEVESLYETIKEEE